MLWDAGQDRVARESRGRMREMWAAVRDGYASAQVSAGEWRSHGDVTPEYAQSEISSHKTGDDLFRDFAHLVTQRADH